MQSIVTSSALQELNLKRAWDIAFASAEDPRKALVPVQPVLHDIILHVWAYNVGLLSQCEDPSKMNNMDLDQSFWSLDVEQNQTEATDVSEHMHVSDSTSEPTAKKSLLSAFDVVGSSHSRFVDLPPRPPKKVVSLPTSIPSMDNLTPIVMSTVRRNPRLNKSDGYQHCQYAPRKRSRKSTTAATSEQAKPIEAMPELHGQDLTSLMVISNIGTRSGRWAAPAQQVCGRQAATARKLGISTGWEPLFITGRPTGTK